MKEAKKALRKAVRSVITTGLDGAAGDLPCTPCALAERIEALPRFAEARTVALYSSLWGEVPTDGMLRRWHGVKRLALPVVLSGEEMVFREYTGEGNLTPGAFGILEPASVSSRHSPPSCHPDRAGKGDEGYLVPPAEIDLMLVPGVAFDAEGRRLGRGGGFYDRYLSRPDAAHIYKVGLCRSGALVPEVPAEAHDVTMDIVITN